MNGNGFASPRNDEDPFAPPGGLSALRSFDAFPKTKTSYLQRTRNGGVFTIVLALACSWLAATEIFRWARGTTTHTYSVEKGIEHTLQLNVDVVVAMECADVQINAQDASGDRILAGEKLSREPTLWATWDDAQATAARGHGAWKKAQREQYSHEDDVHEYLAQARGRKTYKRTPKLPRAAVPDACRIFGNLDGNKVQGDFHITARGHGYEAFGDHLSHEKFNFSHHINELSFGPFFPLLENPLDETQTTTEFHMYRYQYYLSVVPTIYTDKARYLESTSPVSLTEIAQGKKKWNRYMFPPYTLFTNQYAVTEQSHTVSEAGYPGIFFKYDIEPILLMVSEEWGSFLGLIVKVVNVIAGVMVAGSWVLSLSEWALDSGFLGRALRRRGMSLTGGGLLAPEKKSTD